MSLNLDREKGFSIGNLRIGSRAISAPLAGFSDRSFRTILRSFGCQLVYTEMISAEGLIRNNRQTFNVLDIDGESQPIAVQIFGNNPDSLARAARIVEDKGASIIDLNLGCPVKKVARSGAGVGLLEHPNNVAEIIRAIKKAIEIPLTVKMRSGTERHPRAFMEIAVLLEEEGVDAVCLHPRTKEQLYAGKADWTQIAELKNRLRIPVIGNGDVGNGADVLAMIKTTGCDAVMIGRGALGNPWIFQEAMALLGESDRESSPPTDHDRIQGAISHLCEMIGRKGEKRGMMEFRKHGMYYLKRLPVARKARSQFYLLNSLEQTKEFLTTASFG